MAACAVVLADLGVLAYFARRLWHDVVDPYNLKVPPRIPDLYPLEWMYGDNPQAGIIADSDEPPTRTTERLPAYPDARRNFHIGLEAEWPSIETPRSEAPSNSD